MKRLVATSLVLTLGLASAVLAQVSLRAQNPEGTTTYLQTMAFDQTLNIAGMDFPTKADINITIAVTNGRPDADGKVKVQQRQENAVASFSLPMNLSLMFDTSKPETAKNDNPTLQQIIDGLSSLQGKTFTRVVDRDNRVTAVEGVDVILEKTAPSVREEIKRELDLAEQQRVWTQDVKRLPDGPVKMGDRWKRSEMINVGAGQSLTFDVIYDYQGTVEKNGKTYDKVGIFHENVKFAIAPDSALPIRVANQELKIDSTTGILLFDRERGEVFDTTQTVKVVGPLGLTFNDMPLPGKLDLTMTLAQKKK